MEVDGAIFDYKNKSCQVTQTGLHLFPKDNYNNTMKTNHYSQPQYR